MSSIDITEFSISTQRSVKAQHFQCILRLLQLSRSIRRKGYGMSRNRAEAAELAAKPQIMLVEDEAHIATMLRYNLEKSGFAVIEVANGEDALVLMAERKPDAVLLDWGLP